MESSPPRVMDEILRFARAVERSPIRLDKGRLCFLVSDDEWYQLVWYQNSLCLTQPSNNPNGVTFIFILGIEVVKRSALSAKETS
jgi:hypothetical protein